jgi:hypothetical protein
MPSGYAMAKVVDVPRLGSLLVLLTVSPMLMFVAHAIAYRALDRTGAKPTAHFSALVALLGSFVVVCGVGWRLGIFDRSRDVTTALCAFAYLACVYGALGILYLDVVNIAETSLHMHLLLELAWSRGAPVVDLRERYSADRMMAARLERLTSLGQIRTADGRCYIANRSTLYLASCIDGWRVVLGLPIVPPGAASEPSVAGERAGP